MAWPLDTSVPYISESNGVIERQNGAVYDGLRSRLHRAGSAQGSGHWLESIFVTSLTLATKIYLMHTDLIGIARTSADSIKSGSVLGCHSVLWSTLFPLEHAWQLRIWPKADPRAVPGLFLGYSFAHEGKFKQKYRF